MTSLLWNPDSQKRFARYKKNSGDRANRHYYEVLSGAFDYVMTTNYTPLILQVLPEDKKEEKNVIRLSGSLAQFERLDTLTVEPPHSPSLDQSDGTKPYFPFLMSQSPVKPMINMTRSCRKCWCKGQAPLSVAA